MGEMTVHGGNWQWAAETYHRSTFVDLSANINPYGPPSGVWEILKQSLSEITLYPDPNCKELCFTIAEKFAIPFDHILAGNGAGELIFTLLYTLKPQKVAIPTPAFSEYAVAAKACGAKISTIPLGELGWSKFIKQKESSVEGRIAWSESLRQEIRNSLQDCDLLFLCSPHNPTGSYLDPTDLNELFAITLEMNCKVLLDESFIDFLPDTLRNSMRNKTTVYPHLIVIYSLTKFYSIPGLRLGVMFAPKEIIEKCKRFRDPWAVNILAAKAGIAALNDPVYPLYTRGQLIQNKNDFYRKFSEANFTNLKLLPTTVNFALIEVLDRSAAVLVNQLGQRGILVRDCSDFDDLCGEYVRVAIKDETAMNMLLDTLQDITETEHEMR